MKGGNQHTGPARYYTPLGEAHYKGIKDQVRAWMMKQAFTFDDGSKLFRTWKSNGRFIYYTTVEIFDK